MTSAASAAEAQNDGLYLRPMGQAEAPFASAPRLAQSVQLDIAAIVARGTVIQLFRNDSTDWVEGRYRFPLPDKAAVDRLTIRVNDRVEYCHVTYKRSGAVKKRSWYKARVVAIDEAKKNLREAVELYLEADDNELIVYKEKGEVSKIAI